MARAVGLAASYKALTRRGTRPDSGGQPPRPRGSLIWIHCPRLERRPAAEQLARRLIAQEDAPCSVLLTLERPAALAAARPATPGLYTAILPEDAPPSVTEFFEHWQPDVLIWLTGHLRPLMLSQARKAGLPMLLAEAEADAFDEGRLRLRVPQGRRLLAGFSRYFVTRGNGARRLQRLGAEVDRIEITGHLQEGGLALPCDEAQREELADEMAGRPLWLAAMVHGPELDIILDAQRSASRLAHRLLLILVPDDPEDAEGMAERLSAEGWRFLRWSDGELPRDETQILLADTRGEMGLWYRLSPVTFMAGSLKKGMKGHDPFEPAALGSAVIYGPHVPAHLAAYTRLSQAGAARLVRDADDLQKALSRLLAPDQAATMAAAAWQITTEGAEMTDRVIDWVTERLDEKGLI